MNDVLADRHHYRVLPGRRLDHDHAVVDGDLKNPVLGIIGRPGAVPVYHPSIGRSRACQRQTVVEDPTMLPAHLVDRVRQGADYVGQRAASRAWLVVDRWRRLGTTTPPLRSLLDEGVLTMGRHSYGEPLVHVWRRTDESAFGGKVRIGAFVSIAPGVQIFTGGNHRPDWVSTFPFHHRFSLPGVDSYGLPASRGDVTIGNDVWLGYGACILSGTQIGDGAVVGAGAVVSSDIRPYAIVTGSPAREVRRRFSDDQVQALLALQWWSWSIDQILAHVDHLCSDDVQALLDLANQPSTGAT